MATTIDMAKNFAKVIVSGGYTSANNNIGLNLAETGKLPSGYPFNLTWWDSTTYNDPSDDPNVEVVRATGTASNTIIVSRAQEGSTATNKNTAGSTYRMIAGLTAKVINNDIAPALITNMEMGNQLIFRSPLGASVNAFTPFSGNAYFVYCGRTTSPVVPQYVWAWVNATGQHASTQESQIGIFTGSYAPNGSGQILYPLPGGTSGTIMFQTVSNGMFMSGFRSPQFNTQVPANTHLWAGIRTRFGTAQPTVGGIVGDYQRGYYLIESGGSNLTGKTIYTGQLVSGNLSAGAPDLSISIF